MIRLTVRCATAALAAIVALAALGSTAHAHVTVNAPDATAGGFAKLTFRVPNERDDASTTTVEIVFPEEHPIANVSVKPQPGWSYTVESGTPATPVEAHGEEVDEVVTRVVWEGGPIEPGEFAEFEISAGPLPADADQLVFPALQTYSSGEVIRWIDEPIEGGGAPERPAPVLSLAAGDGGDGHGHGAGGGAGAEDEDTASEDEDAGAGAGSDEVTDEQASPEGAGSDGESDETALAVAGIVLGALGLVAGGVAIVRTRR